MAKWQLSGDYFENRNCDVVCPCLATHRMSATGWLPIGGGRILKADEAQLSDLRPG